MEGKEHVPVDLKVTLEEINVLIRNEKTIQECLKGSIFSNLGFWEIHSKPYAYDFRRQDKAEKFLKKLIK